MARVQAGAREIMRGDGAGGLRGIGVGGPGIVDCDSGIIEISIGTPWLEGGIHVKTYLAETLELPVYVANRSQVAALGENLAGVGRNVSNLIYFVLDQGIVAGFVIHGSLYLGSGFASGQIGHVSIEPDGPLCRCGNRGCLQLYASEEAILARARAVAREAGCSVCIAMTGDQLSPGQYAISTSKRNFEGRQGKGGRRFLASPLTAAASAIMGEVSDPRALPGIESLATVGGR